MKAAQMKSARWALALLLALVCAAVVALPMLASADTEPEIAQVGEVNDRQADEVEQRSPVGIRHVHAQADEGASVQIQSVTSIDKQKLDVFGRSPSLSVGEPTTNLSQLSYSGNTLNIGTDYTIVGYVPRQGNSAPTADNYTYPNTEEPITTPGSYFLIVEGVHSGDSGYSDRGYVEFSVENSNGGGQGGDPNNGQGGNGGDP